MRGERGPVVRKAIRCFVGFAVAWSLQTGVSFAEADWLDRASGPGPFKGFFVHYRLLCVSGEQPKPVQPAPNGDIHFTFLTPFDRTASALHLLAVAAGKRDEVNLASNDPKTACRSDNRNGRGYFEVVYNRLASVSNELVEGGPQVHILSYEAAYVSRLTRAFDVRLALAKNHIDPHRRGWFGDFDKDKAQDAFNSFTRMSVSPSVIWSPLAMGGDSKWAHLVQVQGGVTIFVGGFHAQDFCNTGVKRCLDPTWETHGSDVIPMARLLIDASQLLPW